MHKDELWQVFTNNGQPVEGHGELDNIFSKDTSLVMGNAHVWFWSEHDGKRAILLQKRSKDRKRSPGKYHISAAGHINVDETPVDTAVRETQEEMGVTLDVSKLYFVQTVRGGRSGESLNSIFIYQTNIDEEFSFDDGEVESFKWVSLSDFKNMIKTPDNHNLVDQGYDYFSEVIKAVERQ